MTLTRFAYRISGPRDLVINAMLNGAIAWLVFGSRQTVPVAGEGSIFVMILPMVFIESSLTTFFGYFNGVLQRRLGRVEPTLSVAVPWASLAIRVGLTWGTGMLAAFAVVMYALAHCAPTWTMSGSTAVALIVILSASLAYLLHVRAVLRSRMIVEPDPAKATSHTQG
jgi:hypothetical protein